MKVVFLLRDKGEAPEYHGFGYRPQHWVIHTQSAGASQKEQHGIGGQRRQLCHFSREGGRVYAYIHFEEYPMLFLSLFWIPCKYSVNLRCYHRCMCSGLNLLLNSLRERL